MTNKTKKRIEALEGEITSLKLVLQALSMENASLCEKLDSLTLKVDGLVNDSSRHEEAITSILTTKEEAHKPSRKIDFGVDHDFNGFGR